MNHLAPLGEVYQAGTLSGNPVAMVAGYTALSLLDDALYQRLETKTDLLVNPLQECVKRKGLNIAIQRASSMFTIFFGAREVKDFNRHLDLEEFRRFYTYLLEKGIYFSPAQYEGNFISDAHSEEHLIYTRDVILEYLESLS
jgi:glutamate-1-semialdehyde 2,1-aminomutase